MQMLNVWPIYLHLGSFGGFHVGIYTSPIEHMGYILLISRGIQSPSENGNGT